jgi:hypothetical protein
MAEKKKTTASAPAATERARVVSKPERRAAKLAKRFPANPLLEVVAEPPAPKAAPTEAPAPLAAALVKAAHEAPPVPATTPASSVADILATRTLLR